MVPTAKYPANLDEEIYKTDSFRMFCFKVLPCSKRFCHDWTTCPFAHPSEKATRRDPRVTAYTGVACQEMKKNGFCPRGDACTFAHNVFEYWLHPSRYRTQLCNDGIHCARKQGCFFAHTNEEVRQPDVNVETSAMSEDLVYQQSLLDSFSSVDPLVSRGHDEIISFLPCQQRQRSIGNIDPSSPAWSPLTTAGDIWDQMPTQGQGAGPSKEAARGAGLFKPNDRHRMSVEAGLGGGSQAGETHLQQANAIHMQMLQLDAMKAQLQLKHAAVLQSLAAQHQPTPFVDQLAHAMAQMQVANEMASAPDLQTMMSHQPQQQVMPGFNLMQTMLLHQQQQQTPQLLPRMSSHVSRNFAGPRDSSVVGRSAEGPSGRMASDDSFLYSSFS